MMTNVRATADCFHLKVSEWSVLLAGVTFCGFLTLFF